MCDSASSDFYLEIFLSLVTSTGPSRDAWPSLFMRGGILVALHTDYHRTLAMHQPSPHRTRRQFPTTRGLPLPILLELCDMIIWRAVGVVLWVKNENVWAYLKRLYFGHHVHFLHSMAACSWTSMRGELTEHQASLVVQRLDNMWSSVIFPISLLVWLRLWTLVYQ